MKGAFDILRAEKASALSSLELEKKENEELQASVLSLSRKVSDLEKENHLLISNRQSHLKQFQDFTAGFVQALKSETQRVLSLQHADLDFSPIMKISLRELGDIVKRERATSTNQPSMSADPAEGSRSAHAEGLAIISVEKSLAPSAEIPIVLPPSEVGEPSEYSGDAVLALPTQKE